MAGVLRDPFVAIIGADWTQQLRWKTNGVVNDLSTGYTARMQIRRSVTDTDAVYELNTENDGITLDDEANIVLYIPAAETALIPPGEYRFSLILIQSSSPKPLLMGPISFVQDATV